MHHQTEIEHRALTRPQTGRRKTVVIADDGRAAAVVVLDDHQPTTAGSVFEHLGRSWVIRGARHGSRVLVAEPLATLQQ
ncbi:MAG: hypothetical protein AB1Z65_10655 [Candidatus Sulfomarinibacteraceae bacterium]